MGLFKTVRNMFRGAADKANDALKDDVRDGKYAIEDSKKQIDKFTESIAKLMTENENMKKKVEATKAEVEKFENLAESFAKKGIEAAVREAVGKKNTARRQFETFESELKKGLKLVGSLTDQREALKNKIEQAEGNLSSLSARKQSADIRKDVAKSAMDLSNNDGLSALDDLEKAVDQSESEASSWENMQAVDNDDLEAKYGSVEINQSDDETAALMNKYK